MSARSVGPGLVQPVELKGAADGHACVPGLGGRLQCADNFPFTRCLKSSDTAS